jgi:transposase
MDGRTISHEVLESFRFSAIEFHRRGVPVEDIAKSFGVTRQAVYYWLRLERENGKNSLKSVKSPGPECYLTEKQFSKLLSLIRKPASELGYSTDLWSGPRIRHLIKQKFKVEYHVKHMPRLMKNLGLELKFPERRALEQDPEAVREWKEKRFPKILKLAKKKRSLVFYADESLITLMPYIGKTWAFPDKKPIVRVSGMRGQNIGITAAINQQGRMCFELTKDKERFTARVFIRFIKKMRKAFPDRHIILIVDGAPTHKAKIVKAFEEENVKWLQLEILPAYSPELNPTEKSWRFLKTKKLNGSMAKDKKELRTETIKNVRKIKKDKERISSFFNEL